MSDEGENVLYTVGDINNFSSNYFSENSQRNFIQEFQLFKKLFHFPCLRISTFILSQTHFNGDKLQQLSRLIVTASYFLHLKCSFNCLS